VHQHGDWPGFGSKRVTSAACRSCVINQAYRIRRLVLVPLAPGAIAAASQQGLDSRALSLRLWAVSADVYCTSSMGAAHRATGWWLRVRRHGPPRIT
jgi:hypothetical protein